MKHHPAAWLHRLGIPEDVLLDTPVMDIQEFHTVHIVNYTGIAELTGETVRIGVANGEYIIDGKHLVINQATHRELVIQGEIRSLTLVNRKRAEAS